MFDNRPCPLLFPVAECLTIMFVPLDVAPRRWLLPVIVIYVQLHDMMVATSHCHYVQLHDMMVATSHCHYVQLHDNLASLIFISHRDVVLCENVVATYRP